MVDVHLHQNGFLINSTSNCYDCGPLVTCLGVITPSKTLVLCTDRWVHIPMDRGLGNGTLTREGHLFGALSLSYQCHNKEDKLGSRRAAYVAKPCPVRVQPHLNHSHQLNHRHRLKNTHLIVNFAKGLGPLVLIKRADLLHVSSITAPIRVAP